MPTRDLRQVWQDKPVPFGYKMSWLAISSGERDAIESALGLTNVQPCTWSQGISLAYASQVFVTPRIGRWTLVVGKSLPTVDSDEWLPILVRLSKSFGEAQYFCTNRVSGYSVWARVRDGHVVRAYARVGWSIICDVGEKTREEEDLGFNFLDDSATEEQAEEYQERGELAIPDEDSVLAIAEKWSINPLKIESQVSEGTGLVGQFSMHVSK